ncbi:alpha/beta fold hydrolase [Paenibacillus tundrae]|uniref:alpha/beta fold hydrolase n=1 Tax=Paenibacillus tundrae TaxID=528187 RepID=UPI0030D455BB
MKKEQMISAHMELNQDFLLDYQYYVQRASQETLVFIHAHSVDRRMWEPQIDHFASRYSILCYDLRGYGKSSMPLEGQPFLHAEDLRALLEHLNIETAHLIGLSLGSFVALDFWVLYPEYVQSVTVASGAIPDPKPDVPTPLVTDVPRFKQEWFERLLEGCGEDRNGYQHRLLTMIGDWKVWQSTHREPDCILGKTLLPKLTAMQDPGPVCVVNGAKDFPGAHHSADRLLECMPHAICVNLPEAGHFSNMEAPYEFNAALQAFLDKGEDHNDSKPDSTRL